MDFELLILAFDIISYCESISLNLLQSALSSIITVSSVNALAFMYLFITGRPLNAELILLRKGSKDIIYSSGERGSPWRTPQLRLNFSVKFLSKFNKKYYSLYKLIIKVINF